ncbi:zinc metalloproteinase nas-13 [Drosophila guanche]|uniref:Metalloendopeptidase n=1 Tax=Drosophila guanche TaxID=7266 RepID=A0A3B0KDU7_DROGU|nr:zinc metalloproteinase nas-13 [Drosophila guanche]SPP81838.1 blast:Zinc metalloproteinase nas-13 [Drosophila guanche]
MHNLTLGLLLTIAWLVQARPPTTAEADDDMRLTPEQVQLLDMNGGPRIAHSWSGYYWKGSTLVYSFGEGLSSWDNALIEKAMAAISSQTCVRFRKTRNAKDLQVVIQRKEAGCWSYVGFLGRQQQLLNLGERCMSSRTIQHELLHSLGLFHTHCDPKRDRYVKIYTENLKPGFEHNFRLIAASEATDLKLGYDYESIMHYGEYAFSKNGLPTIVPLQKDVKIGQAEGLSANDVRKLNRMYCQGSKRQQ